MVLVMDKVRGQGVRTKFGQSAFVAGAILPQRRIFERLAVGAQDLKLVNSVFEIVCIGPDQFFVGSHFN